MCGRAHAFLLFEFSLIEHDLEHSCHWAIATAVKHGDAQKTIPVHTKLESQNAHHHLTMKTQNLVTSQLSTPHLMPYKYTFPQPLTPHPRPRLHPPHSHPHPPPPH